MTKTLTTEQALRYNRQILLPGFDIDRQEMLLNSHVLMVGVGGLGCACAQYLVTAGVGALTIVDDDMVETTNLQRQVLHTESAVGEAKVESAANILRNLNSECLIHTLQRRLDASNINEIAQDIDIIVDCSDNLATRNLLNELSLTRQLPLVSGAAIRTEGQYTSFIPGPDSPCYLCLSSLFGEQQLSCVESGVLSPLVGIIGTMQALEAIKILTHFGTPAAGTLHVFDGQSGQWQAFKLPKKASCPACAR